MRSPIPHDDSVFQYHAYRTLTGNTALADLHRRNGQLTVRFSGGWDDTETLHTAEDLPLDAYMDHLTPTERHTWARILDGRSIPDIAREDGVSHAAIYARIRGRGRPWGGMVAKNQWVALWWARRCQRL